MPLLNMFYLGLGVVFWFWSGVVFNKKLSRAFTDWYKKTPDRDLIDFLQRWGDSSPYYPTATSKGMGVITAMLGLIFIFMGLWG